jgi:hypothetical protein
MSPTSNNMLASENVKLATAVAEEAIAPGLCIKPGTGAGSCVVAGAGEKPMGVAYSEATASGQAISYFPLTPGSLCGRALAGAAIASVETDLAVDASGKLIAATTSDQIVGQNVQAAAADGDQVQVRFEDGNRVAA